MKLTIEIVRKVVKGWVMIFPGKRSPEELDYITAKYLQQLKGTYNTEQFIRAAELAERETEFFPTIHLLLSMRTSAYQVAASKPMACGVKRLEEETKFTDGEIALNLKKIQVLTKVALGEMSVKEGLEKQKELDTVVSK